MLNDRFSESHNMIPLWTSNVLFQTGLPTCIPDSSESPTTIMPLGQPSTTIYTSSCLKGFNHELQGDIMLYPNISPFPLLQLFSGVYK